MRDTPTFASIRNMQNGRRRIVIEFDATDGPPQGRISADGARKWAFHGWMDLTACLEALRPSARAAKSDARVERGLEDVGDRVEDHDEEGAVDRDDHDRPQIQPLQRVRGVLPDAL